VFIEDRSLERGMRVLSLINQLSQSRTPESENGSAAADNQELEV
jgi:hypothetical protein